MRELRVVVHPQGVRQLQERSLVQLQGVSSQLQEQSLVQLQGESRGLGTLYTSMYSQATVDALLPGYAAY